MHKLIFLTLFFSFLTSLGYSQKEVLKVSYEFTKPYGKIKLDTTEKELLYRKSSSKRYHLTYTYNFVGPYWAPDTTKVNEEYKFILNKEHEAYRLNYKVCADDVAIKKVPLKFIDSKEFELAGSTFTIYKYLFDLENSIDEELLFFFTPQYGIIMENSIAWPSYVKLLNYSKSEDDKLINKLCEVILYDSNFFNNYARIESIPTPMEIFLNGLIDDTKLEVEKENK